MLWKAIRTKDLHSYSVEYWILANVGNMIHWIYVIDLPMGPIWGLHTFATFSTFFMTYMYWRYSKRCK